MILIKRSALILFAVSFLWAGSGFALAQIVNSTPPSQDPTHQSVISPGYGTGYPSGIKGTDIPIGARILSVVDCFDALTSDRPYRPKLSDADALAILKERRG